MDGPAGPSPCQLRVGGEGHCTDMQEDRLSAGSSVDSCQCNKTQPEVTLKGKRFGRGAVESGKDGFHFWAVNFDIICVSCVQHSLLLILAQFSSLPITTPSQRTPTRLSQWLWAVRSQHFFATFTKSLVQMVEGLYALPQIVIIQEPAFPKRY